MLQLRGIKKEYPAGVGTVEALKGIDLEFRESEFVSILGPSGCGKTTMLNIIGGLDKYSEGDLVLSSSESKPKGEQETWCKGRGVKEDREEIARYKPLLSVIFCCKRKERISSLVDNLIASFSLRRANSQISSLKFASG